jgi:hypothetical protein
MVLIRAAMVAALNSTVRVASYEAVGAEEARRQSIQSLACNHFTRERRGVALSICVRTMWARVMGPFRNRARGVCRAGRARLGEVADGQVVAPSSHIARFTTADRVGTANDGGTRHSFWHWLDFNAVQSAYRKLDHLEMERRNCYNNDKVQKIPVSR